MKSPNVCLCMKDPGPCHNCGAQTSLMYAAFTPGRVVNDRFVSGERVSDALCNECINMGAALILYPGWSKEAGYHPGSLADPRD